MICFLYNDLSNYVYHISIISGASMGISGIPTYVTIINKCEGVLEIIGLSLIFEYCIRYLNVTALWNDSNIVIIFTCTGIITWAIGLIILLYFKK